MSGLGLLYRLATGHVARHVTRICYVNDRHVVGYSTPRLFQSKFNGIHQQPKRHHFSATSDQGDKSSMNTKDGEMSLGHLTKVVYEQVWPKEQPWIRKRVKVAMGLLVMAKVCNTCVPYVFKHAVDYLNLHVNLSVGGAPTETVVAISTSIMIGYGLARASASGFGELRNAVFATVSQHSVRKIALDVFRHLHKMDLDFHLNRQTGALAKTIDRGSRGIAAVLSALVFNVLPTVFELALVTSVLSFTFGTKYALVALSAVSSYAVFTLLVTQWRTQFRLKMNRADNEAGNQAIDSLINFETVKYFNGEEYEATQYDKSLQKFEKASLKTSQSLALLNFGQNLIFSTALTAMMVLAANDIVKGNTMTVGDLVMVNGLLFQLSVPLNFLGSVFRDVRLALTDMQLMFKLLDLKPNIETRSEALIFEAKKFTSNVIFDNVHFGYMDNHPILKGLNLEIENGSKVAIVGGSGSGKSTIVRLLFRFYDPKNGCIRIGPHSITDFDLESLRRGVAVVPQDSVLFNNTIRHNIRYGNLMSTDREVERAAMMAELHDTIMRWPRGYDTEVGERGLKLSGGEKQRLSIARAILKDAPILVFDEATSSLDSITESQIMRALKQATMNKTSILIAHRLSTIVDSDQIYVLDQGHVVEQGRHEELLRQRESVYHQLWMAQHKEAFKSKQHFDDLHST